MRTQACSVHDSAECACTCKHEPRHEVSTRSISRTSEQNLSALQGKNKTFLWADSARDWVLGLPQTSCCFLASFKTSSSILTSSPFAAVGFFLLLTFLGGIVSVPVSDLIPSSAATSGRVESWQECLSKRNPGTERRDPPHVRTWTSMQPGCRASCRRFSSKGTGSAH